MSLVSYTVQTSSRDLSNGGLASKKMICPQLTSTLVDRFVPGSPTSSPFSTGYSSRAPPHAESQPFKNEPDADGWRADEEGADGGELGRYRI